MPDLPLDKLTVMALLGLAVTAFARGWIVTGSTYQQAFGLAERLLETNDKLSQALAQKLKQED